MFQSCFELFQDSGSVPVRCVFVRLLLFSALSISNFTVNITKYAGNLIYLPPLKKNQNNTVIIMSEALNFCTEILSFCGFGCDTVDFVTNNDPEDDSRLEKTCAGIPRFLWAVEKVLLLVDIANFIFDIIFTVKLFVVHHEPKWGIVMAVALVVTFVTTMFIGKLLLNHIKHFQPSQTCVFRIRKHPVYYKYWSNIELSAFLLEDSTTIFLYWSVNGIFNRTNTFDVVNLYTSLTSGILSMVAYLITSYCLRGDEIRGCLTTVFVFIAVPHVSVACLSAVSLLKPEIPRVWGTEAPFSVVSSSSILGYSSALYILASLYFYKIGRVEWPTDTGMHPQSQL